MKKALVFLLIAVTVLTLTGCSAGSGSRFTTDRVVMTYVASPLNVPSVLDRRQGNYREAFRALGLDFAYSELDSGADQTAALASGGVHILNAVGASSVLLAAANGSDIVILSMYSVAPGAFAMFSRDDSISTPEDLRGKTVAGPKGTNLHELLAAYLASAGMTTADVDFLSMDIPSSAAALENGSVDVALLGGPAAYNCEASGRHKITDGVGLIPAAIVTAASREFAEKNPEIIRTFLNTQKTLTDSIREQTEEALAATAETLGLEPQAVADMYAMYDFDPTLSEEELAGIRSTERFLYDSGMIDAHVDVDAIIYR